MEESVVQEGNTYSLDPSPSSTLERQEGPSRGSLSPGDIPSVTVTPASDVEDQDNVGHINNQTDQPSSSIQQHEHYQQSSRPAANESNDYTTNENNTDNNGDYSNIMRDWDGPWFNSGYQTGDQDQEDQGEQTTTEGIDGREPGDLYHQHTNPAFTGDESDTEDRTSIGSTPSDPDDTYREFSEANTLKIRGDDPSKSDQSNPSHFIIQTKPKPADGVVVESQDVIVTVGADVLTSDDVDSGTRASSEGHVVPQLVRPVRRRPFPSMKPSGTPKSRKKMILVVIGIVVVAILLVITVVLLVVLRGNRGDSGQQ